MNVKKIMDKLAANERVGVGVEVEVEVLFPTQREHCSTADG